MSLTEDTEAKILGQPDRVDDRGSLQWWLAINCDLDELEELFALQATAEGGEQRAPIFREAAGDLRFLLLFWFQILNLNKLTIVMIMILTKIILNGARAGN